MGRKSDIFGKLALVGVAVVGETTRKVRKTFKEATRPLDAKLLFAIRTDDAASAERVAQLIKRGANINARHAPDGRTPLMCAAWMNPKCVAVLLASGADLSLKNDKGETALDIAAKCERQNGVSEMRTQIETAMGKNPQPPRDGNQRLPRL